MGLFGKKKDGKKSFQLRHLQGLNEPDIGCTVVIDDGALQIKIMDNEYNLNLSQISSVAFDMDVDIEKYAKSSIAKGVAGASLFGTPGAVVGSAPKTHEKRLVTTSAVVGYIKSDGSSDFILLQDLEPNALQAAKFVDTIKPLITTSTKSINL